MTTLHNLDAEQGLLGALILDNSFEDRLPPLLADHFYDPVHGDIWNEISRDLRAKRPVDAVTLQRWFLSRPYAAELGGVAYLTTLIAHAARLNSQAIQYAHVIKAFALRRELARIGAELVADASAGDDPLEVMGAAERKLRGLDTGEADEGCDLAEAALDLISRLDDPEAVGTSTGFATLDQRLGGLHKSELILIAGRPSMGKTAFATSLARNLTARGRKVHFASLEMGRSQIAARCLSAASFADEGFRFRYSTLRHDGAGIDRKALATLASELPRSLWIDDLGGQSLAQLEARARGTRRRLKGLDCIIVDYLQLMNATARGNENERLTEISQGLKTIAKRLDCTVIALAQLNRSPESREDKRPTLADLRGSGSLEQDADAVLGVYREAYYLDRAEPQRAQFKKDEDYNVAWFEWDAKRRGSERTVEIITLKQRQGPVGTDVMEFWAEYDVTVDARAA